MSKLVGPIDEFQGLWQSKAGSVSHLQEPSSKKAIP